MYEYCEAHGGVDEVGSHHDVDKLEVRFVVRVVLLEPTHEIESGEEESKSPGYPRRRQSWRSLRGGRLVDRARSWRVYPISAKE